MPSIREIIEEIGFIYNKIKPFIVEYDDKKFKLILNDEFVSEQILEKGISSCWDIGIKVYFNDKYLGWF